MTHDVPKRRDRRYRMCSSDRKSFQDTGRTFASIKRLEKSVNFLDVGRGHSDTLFTGRTILGLLIRMIGLEFQLAATAIKEAKLFSVVTNEVDDDAQMTDLRK
jgi:hypothetical protein